MTEQNNEITLWHGGRNLEHYHNRPQISPKGRWEHGPGLYLTTHYETARKYAKGGGKTYKVTIELGNHIKDINIHIQEVLDFVLKNVIKSKQKDILNDIHNNIKRMNSYPYLEAETLVNLCINYEAVKGEKTISLNRFLVNHNVDYSTSDRFSGRDETICIIYNLDKIKKIKAISAKDVSLVDFELSANPISFIKKLKI
jgi:hypothetical protein